MEVDLDAEIEMQWDSFNKHIVKYDDESEDVVWLNWNSFVDVARNFYELGKYSKWYDKTVVWDFVWLLWRSYYTSNV